MKKLLVLLFSILISFNSYAKDRVYLTCEFYSAGEGIELDGSNTLTIFPNSYEYIYGEYSGKYKEKEDSITWSGSLSKTLPIRFTLNRISGEMTEEWLGIQDGEIITGTTLKSKCTKIESLF